MNSTGISVVIPNYNGKELLSQTLPDAYTALNNSGQQFEVIIVDDCSTDSSVELISKDYPAVRLLQNDVNKGFSPTVNKGVFAAQFDHVLILNSDVKLSENYFQNLLRYFDKEDTFGVMSRIVGWDDDKIQDGAKYPHFHGTKIKTTGNYVRLEPTKDDWLYSMYLSGANAFVSRRKFVELKGLNEIFAPFYVEDYELSLRAWRLGYKCYYDHFTICRHRESVTIKNKSRKGFINTIYYRNKMFLHAMHLPSNLFFTWYMQNLLEILFQTIIGKTYYVKAFFLFVKNNSNWKRSKNDFKELCESKGVNITLKDVANTITGSIEAMAIRKF